MTIKSRKHAVARATSAPTLGAAALLTSLSLAPLAHAADQATTLDEVNVRAMHYTSTKPDSPKFTQALIDTPQTIQIIGKDLFNEQGATTLTEALRNTPGVGTFYAGENGNTTTGDAIYMRGFDSSSSIFVDGIRDLGSVSRDVFNLEQIEVEKGPAGTDNGRSAPTGAINLVSKKAHLGDAVSGTLSAGNYSQRRGTADWNQQLGATSALRLNAMWQDSDKPGRDHVNNKRWGLAPSLGFGLGTDTRYFLNLYYVKQENVPDGNVPTIGLPGWEPQDGLEQLVGHKVDPENFYGTQYDHDDVTAKMATFRFEHDFSDAVSLTNTARWGETKQDYLLTAFMSTNSNIVYSDVNDLSSYTLARSLPTYKDQTNKILTDQLNLRADFATGAVQHNLSTGLELTREEQVTRGMATQSGSWPAASLYDPDWNVDGLVWGHTGAGSEGKTTTYSLYAFDTLKFGERLLVTAGLRADRYKTEYISSTACGGSGRGAVACGDLATGTPITTIDADAEDTLLNWKLGVVYKANDDVSLYANYALSQQPPGGSNFELSSSANSANNPNMDPQKAETIEVGTKWNFADDRLLATLAIFQTDVTNEITGSASEGYFQNGKKRVKGVEASLVGNITDAWQISAGYTKMNTKVLVGSTVTADGTYNLTYTPDQAFTSWTSYRLPFGLVVGGGVRYSGEMHRGSDGAKGTPKYTKAYTVWDAMLSYPVSKHFDLRLNLYNVFDKEYVAAINKSGYRYTPGAPRSWLLSASFRF